MLAEHAHWVENGVAQSALWRCESGREPPLRILLCDDRMPADRAYQLACEGHTLLWRGDYQNACQLMRAVARRWDKRVVVDAETQMPAAFHRHRQAQLQRARILGALLVQLDVNYRIALRRAPDVRQACLQAYGETEEGSVVSLRELLGVIGAHEWRKRGIAVPVLTGRIHPHYGVFSPLRSEYLELVARMPVTAVKTAFDIGTGTGVLAALLAAKGIPKLVATDTQERAIICARENIARLQLQQRVQIMQTSLFPPGRADLIVCNPPWLPARANSALDHAVYDPDSRMLRGFLDGLTEHLEAGGEGWLILSDLAQQLGLRSPQALPEMIAAAGLRVVGKFDAKPRHKRVSDSRDSLYAARQAETVSLWQLQHG